jgi:hypothetical protein
MKISCRTAAFAAIGAVIAVPAFAEGDPGRSWFAGASKEDAALTYGTPESDDVVLTLNCVRGSGAVNIFIGETSEMFKPGQKTTVAFGVGAVKASFPGEFKVNEEAGVPSLEARAQAAAPVFAAMNDRETIALAIGAWNLKVPLKGVGAKAAEFVKACSR